MTDLLRHSQPDECVAVTPLSLAEPPHDVPPTSPAGPRVCWTQFSFRLPATAKVPRVTLWRELRRRGGLRLGQGTWAVRDGVGDEDVLATAELIVSTAAGMSSRTAMRGADHTASTVEAALVQACEHLWDAFFNDADRLSVGLDDHTETDADLVTAVEQLRRDFHSLRTAAIVETDSGRRSHRRLRAVEASVPAAPAPVVTPRTLGSRTRLAAPLHQWALDDGSIRTLATVDPWPSLAWERAFNDFEASIYLPSASRAALTQGAFCFRSAPDEQGERLAAQEHRLRVFAASLTP